MRLSRARFEQNITCSERTGPGSLRPFKRVVMQSDGKKVNLVDQDEKGRLRSTGSISNGNHRCSFR